MKKILFILAIKLSFSGVCQAQKIKIGINVGPTYSGFRGMNVPTVDYKYGLGFMAGVSVDYYLRENLSIKANLSYDRKANNGESFYELRVNFDDPPRVYDQTIKNQYDYLTLPIMVKLGFGKNNRFFVNGGPFVGYLLHSETRSSSTSESTIELFYEAPLNTTGFNKRFDYGLSAGIGKSFNITGKNDLVLEIRDNLGLVNTNDAAGGLNIKTNSVNLIVGWTLEL